VCGAGLVDLYHALRRLAQRGGKGSALPPRWPTGPAIERRPGAGALDLFCGFLGSVAGNLALTLGARGGVYLGGGIVPRLGTGLTNPRSARGSSQGALSAVSGRDSVLDHRPHRHPRIARRGRALDIAGTMNRCGRFLPPTVTDLGPAPCDHRVGLRPLPALLHRVLGLPVSMRLPRRAPVAQTRPAAARWHAAGAVFVLRRPAPLVPRGVRPAPPGPARGRHGASVAWLAAHGVAVEPVRTDPVTGDLFTFLRTRTACPLSWWPPRALLRRACRLADLQPLPGMANGPTAHNAPVAHLRLRPCLTSPHPPALPQPTPQPSPLAAAIRAGGFSAAPLPSGGACPA
jgi:hypothetical protein